MLTWSTICWRLDIVLKRQTPDRGYSMTSGLEIRREEARQRVSVPIILSLLCRISPASHPPQPDALPATNWSSSLVHSPLVARHTVFVVNYGTPKALSKSFDHGLQ